MINEFFYYRNKNNKKIVTDKTLQLTPHTFLSKNDLWENDSIEEFYKNIPIHNKYNIIDIGAQSGL